MYLTLVMVFESLPETSFDGCTVTNYYLKVPGFHSWLAGWLRF